MKKKRLLTLLLLFILGISFVHAEKTELYDKWTESDDSFKVGDYKLEPTWTENTLILRINDQTFSLSEGFCVKSKPLEVCYNDTQILKDGKVVPDTIHDSDVDHEMRLIVYGYLAELDIDRTYEKTTILIGEYSDVDVEISNIGEADAIDIEYIETYPETVVVSKVIGCTLDENEISWSGIIRKEGKHECGYRITAIEEDSFTSKASVDYFNDVEDEKESVSTRITIPEPFLDILMDPDKTSLAPGDTTDVLINLTNNEKSTLKVENLRLNLPSGLELVNKDILSSTNTWSGLINHYQEIMIVIKAIKSGKHELTLTADYNYDDTDQSQTKEVDFKVKSDLDIEILENILDLKVNKSSPIRIDLFNPSPKPMYKIRYEITSDLPGFEKMKSSIETLGRNNNHNILNKYFIVKETGEHDINISVKYENEFSEIFSKEFIEKIRITETGSISDSNPRTSGPATTQKTETDEMKDIPDTHIQTGDVDSKRSGLFLLGGVIISALLLLYVRHVIRSN